MITFRKSFIWRLTYIKENIAIYTENEEISYSNLLDRVNDVESTLKKSPQSLVFSKCKNDLNSIVNYLAALRANCPVLLLDDDIDEEYLNFFMKN